MKIICMDCQTESYSDIEGLKGQKRLSCAHCAESLRSNSDNKTGEIMLYASTEDSEFDSDSINESSSEHEIPPPSHDVLDIPDSFTAPENSDSTKIDDVFSFPEGEAKTSFFEKETCATEMGDTQQPLANPIPDGSAQLPAKSVSNFKPSDAVVDSSSQTQSSNESPLHELGGLKKVRLISVSTSKLTVIAAAFVLFIAFVEVLNTPPAKVSVKTENPLQTVSAAAGPEIAHEAMPVPTQAPQISVPPPSPPPVVTENKPAITTSSTDQPSREGKALFTVQVGSHKEMGEANDQAEKLRAAGFEPRVVSVEIPKRGTWYRVQIGNFSDRDEANRFGSQILAKGAAENFVISGL